MKLPVYVWNKQGYLLEMGHNPAEWLSGQAGPRAEAPGALEAPESSWAGACGQNRNLVRDQITLFPILQKGTLRPRDWTGPGLKSRSKTITELG